MQLKELVNSEQGLVELSKKELPIHISFLLGQVLKKAGETLQEYYKQKNKLLEKYGEEIKKDKEGTGQWKIKDVKKFNEEHEKLVNVIIKFNIKKIKEKEFMESGVSVKPETLANLYWLFE